MAYIPGNLYLLVGDEGTTVRMRIWQYDSVDAATTVRAAGYITDAAIRGMRVGDVVFQRDTDSSPYAIQIMTVAAITSGAADLSDGVAITATNT